MWGRPLALWAVFAFVTWNVAFDRQVSRAAFTFTSAQVERRLAADPVSTIEEGFLPRVRAAGLIATAWACGVLGLGLAVTWRTRSPRDGRS